MHITQLFKSNSQGFPRGTVVLSVSNGLKGARLCVECEEHQDSDIPLYETKKHTGLHTSHSLICMSDPLHCSPSHCSHQSELEPVFVVWLSSLALAVPT